MQPGCCQQEESNSRGGIGCAIDRCCIDNDGHTTFCKHVPLALQGNSTLCTQCFVTAPCWSNIHQVQGAPRVGTCLHQALTFPGTRSTKTPFRVPVTIGPPLESYTTSYDSKLRMDMSATITAALPTKRECPHCGRK
jgi:hypothetical protein